MLSRYKAKTMKDPRLGLGDIVQTKSASIKGEVIEIYSSGWHPAVKKYAEGVESLTEFLDKYSANELEGLFVEVRQPNGMSWMGPLNSVELVEKRAKP